MRTDTEMMKSYWPLVCENTIIKNPYKLSRRFTVVSDSKKASEFINNVQKGEYKYKTFRILRN